MHLEDLYREIEENANLSDHQKVLGCELLSILVKHQLLNLSLQKTKEVIELLKKCWVECEENGNLTISAKRPLTPLSKGPLKEKVQRCSPFL